MFIDSDKNHGIEKVHLFFKTSSSDWKKKFIDSDKKSSRILKRKKEKGTRKQKEKIKK